MSYGTPSSVLIVYELGKSFPSGRTWMLSGIHVSQQNSQRECGCQGWHVEDGYFLDTPQPWIDIVSEEGQFSLVAQDAWYLEQNHETVGVVGGVGYISNGRSDC